MSCHEELNTLPPFIFKIKKKDSDCLSRQVGKAIAILLSKDQVLNSKTQYIQNCISIISIQEDSFERKRRRIQEGKEEKREEAELSKRNENKNLEGNISKKRRLSSHGKPAEACKDMTVSEDMADPSAKEVGFSCN